MWSFREQFLEQNFTTTKFTSMASNPMWNAILRWSTAQTDTVDYTNEDKTIEPMTKERQEFLLKAFESMVVDQTKRIKLIIQVLKVPLDSKQLRQISQQLSALENYQVDFSTTVSDGELVRLVKKRKEEALEELEDLVLGIDNANDLCNPKIGGMRPLLAQLDSPFLSLRWRAAQVLSTVTQNNPKGQSAATAAGAIVPLLGLLTFPQPPLPADFCSIRSAAATAISADEEDETVDSVRNGLSVQVAAKAVLALSSLIRNNEEAEAQFLANDGVRLLSVSLFDSKCDKKLLKKVVSLLRYSWRLPAVRAGGQRMVSALTRLLNDDDVDLREHALQGLLELLLDAENLSFARQTENGLRVECLRRVKVCASYVDPDDVDMVREEAAMLQEVLQLLGQ